MAGIVLGVMAGMASLALAFALVTTHFRRQRDKPPDSSSRPPPVQVVAPADLPALGYLPADTNAILAIHVAEALQQPMGRDLLTRLGFSPVESILETLMARTGFGLEDLDHVVLALQLEQRFVPGGVVVVRTRRPYDAARLRAALDAHPGADRGRKELYRFRLDRPPGDAVLWCATERTLVVGLQPEDLDKVPVIPASGPASLSLPLQKLLKERIGPIGHVWLAGHVERWDRTTVPLALVELPEERAVLTSVRTFAASLQVGPNVTLHAAFDCANEPAAQALEQYLTHRVSDTKAMRELLGDSRPALQKLLGELARTFAVRVQSSWVTAQASATADLMGKVSGAGEK